MKNKKLRNIAAAALIFTGAEACDYSTETSDKGKHVDQASSQIVETVEDIKSRVKYARIVNEVMNKKDAQREKRYKQYQEYCLESLKSGYKILDQKLGKKSSVEFQDERGGALEVTRVGGQVLLKTPDFNGTLREGIEFYLDAGGRVDGRFPESHVVLSNDPNPYHASREMTAKMVLDIFKVK